MGDPFQAATKEFAVGVVVCCHWPFRGAQAGAWPAIANTEEFLRLLSGTGLVEVAVAEHATTYSVPDTETLWRGGLGSVF